MPTSALPSKLEDQSATLKDPESKNNKGSTGKKQLVHRGTNSPSSLAFAAMVNNVAVNKSDSSMMSVHINHSAAKVPRSTSQLSQKSDKTAGLD